MTGSEEHQGYGGDVSSAALCEAVYALRDRGPGELDKASLDHQGRVSVADERRQVVELARPARVAAAVPDDQERGVAPSCPPAPFFLTRSRCLTQSSS